MNDLTQEEKKEKEKKFGSGVISLRKVAALPKRSLPPPSLWDHLQVLKREGEKKKQSHRKMRRRRRIKASFFSQGQGGEKKEKERERKRDSFGPK